MNISVRWLNEFLNPGDLTPDEAERVLTFAGFPIESATPLPDTEHGGDTLLDVEVTSNRGDVLCHLGVAREVAALTGRALVDPRVNRHTADDQDGPELRAAVNVANEAEGGACPLFTAQVIRGVKVGPSPAWMVRSLEAVGQRSINNVVDVTNYIAFELGQPTHVFDLAKLAPTPDGRRRVIVRTAIKGEKIALLDGRTIPLAGDELVVADGEVAVSLAGVMGGASTQVTTATTDVLLEAATWAPTAVRRAARRHQIRTDASYRFERTVDARTIAAAARRAAELIVKTAGGTLVPGVLEAPGTSPNPRLRPRTAVDLRPARCAAILGVSVPTTEIVRIMHAHEIEVRGGEPLRCTIPPHRPDLEREIDLIEEIARTHGLDKLPVHDRVPVRVSAPQRDERAVHELTAVLAGLGFYEAVTFTFVSPAMARPFLPAGLELLQVQDERRKADPVLRPSAIPSLLACRRANQHAGVTGDGGCVRLYEIASAFAQTPRSAPGDGGVERVNLALIADASLPAGGKPHDQLQQTLRIVRGVVEALAGALGGPDARAALELTPASPPCTGFDQRGFASINLRGRGEGEAGRIGQLGVIAPGVQRDFDLQTAVVACELSLHALLALYPPAAARVGTLPAFPAIDRDLSLIVGEQVAWASVHSLVADARVPLLEEAAFVGVYRGRPIEPGKKSVTLRLRFRDPARTLRHDEVDSQVNAIIDLARQRLTAEVRSA